MTHARQEGDKHDGFFRIGRMVFPLLLAAALIAIWLLTVQTPTQTMGLSDVWAAVAMRLLGLPYEQASWLVRKVVHAMEFFPVGLFLSLAIACWERGHGTKRTVVAAAAICFLCSLGDQTHKIFVPGREFDALDMVFDTAGYLLAIAIVHAWTGHLRKA